MGGLSSVRVSNEKAKFSAHSANALQFNLMIMCTLDHALCLVLCSSLHSEEAKIKCLGETSPFGLFLRHHTVLSLRSVVGCWESIFC